MLFPLFYPNKKINLWINDLFWKVWPWCFLLRWGNLTLVTSLKMRRLFRCTRLRHFPEVKLSQHGSVGKKTNNRSNCVELKSERTPYNIVCLQDYFLLTSSPITRWGEEIYGLWLADSPVKSVGGGANVNASRHGRCWGKFERTAELKHGWKQTWVFVTGRWSHNLLLSNVYQEMRRSWQN